MRRDAAAGALPGLVPGARDQSNTSLRFGKRCVMKLYRRVEPGPNPDEEVARFLAERTGFRHVPAWLGSLTWHRGGVTSTLATVTAWVESRGDAWNLTLGHVRAYLARCHDHAVALSNLAPPDHPTRLLADRPPSGLVQDLLGEYGDWARLLGERTAHLHRALASCPEDPAFAPESLTPAHSLHTVASIRRQASAVFHLLRQRLADLPAPVLQDAREVLHLEARVESVLEAATHTGHGHAFVTRHHGDLHLGQVLWTGEDFVVLDFEGEPARPVAERRRKALPLRDVAGMVRSFHYAARAVALEDGVGGEQLAWLEHWFEAAAGLYLRAYLSATQGEPWAPHPGAGKAWLEALVLEKACYELAYELGNRPDWVGIPLHGVLRALRS
jgi:trehalose synthase-fused probable maltokinase